MSGRLQKSKAFLKPIQCLRSWMEWEKLEVACPQFLGTPKYGYGSIPINTIFRGMNIHLPAILMFTRGTRF